MTAVRHTSFWVAGIGLLVSAAVVLQMARDRTYPEGPAVADQVLYIDSGQVIEKIALSYKAVLADLYWIRALQHYGGERLKPNSTERFALLYPLLNLTTSLDPRFTVAYRFGAIFLSEPYPGGAGKPELAIRLLEKAIRTTPEKWEYYHDIGFVYFWNLHDYLKAADWFRRGADLPNSPWWLRTYAAAMMAKGGDRQTARVIWQNILSTTEGEWMRETAKKRLLQLDALDQIDYLRQIKSEFHRRKGHSPESWEQIIAAGLLRGVPADPTGTPYTLNFATGDIAVSGFSPLYPLPLETTPGQP
jgi:tetratricopeptide (TPR) repeat protein